MVSKNEIILFSALLFVLIFLFIFFTVVLVFKIFRKKPTEMPEKHLAGEDLK